MSKLIFTKTQVQELSAFCSDNNLANFFLAKDQGVYIGATVGSHKDNSFKNCIKYAEGCDPEQDESIHGDWWENSAHLCGGGDFGEHLEVSILLNVIKLESWSKFIVTLTPTQLSFSIS
ncbi:DUF3085 domain-containing protein (plasmid) [Vibrio campbellii]|uniref:DUF3085 domain-containing protein n=1 Tax=Vibrio campbellii TaxID=680 RepID=A0ABY5IQ22_9VIBR|nr:DUF3085 domain-containing protein [Vibrio campbellii]UTZ34951.1 DUF3085 domain-containing protein [Vibrio campbellii]